MLHNNIFDARNFSLKDQVWFPIFPSILAGQIQFTKVITMQGSEKKIVI